ncbi:MAG: hypothetical protein GXP10_10050 [Gammaproteobacteria bacterium]|nr:hypothetical protein [Gammaproteobacteria bacterium]
MSHSEHNSHDPDPCMKLKGRLFPLSVLQLNHLDWPQLEAELCDKVAQAPDFFCHAPVVLDLEALRAWILTSCAVLSNSSSLFPWAC